MGYYNDRWIIANINPEEILLLRKSSKELLLDRMKKDDNITTKESIVGDILEEYDCAIGSRGELYIIYQSKEMDLIVKVIDGEDKREIRLTSQAIPEVVDLNIIVEDNKIHIIYLIKIEDKESKYMIYHNYYNGEDWSVFEVGEIVANKLLNPIKLIKEENGIILTYYNNDLEIELKEFDLRRLKWSRAFKLVKNSNEKLYLDMIKYKDSIHFVYCEFQEGILVIKYGRYKDSKGGYERIIEKTISNEGSQNNPTLIVYEDRIWITWVELDKVMSRVSDNHGSNWSEFIYSWNSSKMVDFVRYKYLSMLPGENSILDYSFGSIYPEIEFIGFGPLENASEIPIKNKPIKIARI